MCVCDGGVVRVWMCVNDDGDVGGGDDDVCCWCGCGDGDGEDELIIECVCGEDGVLCVMCDGDGVGVCGGERCVRVCGEGGEM